MKVGLAIVALALAGWLATLLTVPFLLQPRGLEDLTSAWAKAGPTPLGRPTTTEVPPGQTLVAFLVGTDLTGIAGTTTGDCTATRDGAPVPLAWPVYINPSLSGILRQDEQTVAIAGWTNDTPGLVRVEIRCTSGDSTVKHYVALPSGTAVVARDPWFQPWAWVALGAVGAALTIIGLLRVQSAG